MRRIIALTLLSAFAVSVSVAQFNSGNVELGFSGSIGSRSYKISSRYTDSQSNNIFYLGVSPGIYMTQGLSIEPEIIFSAIEKQPPAWSFLLNLSYTHTIDGSKVAPFIRAGFGAANGMPIVPGNALVMKATKELDVVVLNVGGGVKYVIAETVLLRMEINYKHYGWTADANTSYSADWSAGDFGVLAGFSLILLR